MSPPPHPETSEVRCPHCGQPYSVTPEQRASMVGQLLPCTRCGRTFSLSADGAAVVAAESLASSPYAASHAQSQVAYATPRESRSNPLALASLITGVLLCVPVLPGIAAIICGALGIKRAKDPEVSGKGLAIAGLVLGILNLLAWGGYIALMTVILVPSVGRARETANRVKCASNMRQIGLAIALYTTENHGAYPPKLEDLLLTQSITPAVLVCPSGSDTPAPGAGPTEQAANLSAGQHLSYVYVGSGLKIDAPSKRVILYEPMTHHADGMNVLYADGSVRYLLAPSAQQVLQNLQSATAPSDAELVPGDADAGTTEVESTP